MWVTKVSAVVFHGLITSVESIPTSIAVPVGPFESLHTFYSADYVTSLTAAKNLQPCNNV